LCELSKMMRGGDLPRQARDKRNETGECERYNNE
jgi:hypothetical protein